MYPILDLTHYWHPYTPISSMHKCARRLADSTYPAPKPFTDSDAVGQSCHSCSPPHARYHLSSPRSPIQPSGPYRHRDEHSPTQAHHPRSFPSSVISSPTFSSQGTLTGADRLLIPPLKICSMFGSPLHSKCFIFPAVCFRLICFRVSAVYK